MKEITDLLPLGSIVTLNDSDEKLMIFGILQSTGEEGVEPYDYIGVPYPMGNMGPDNQFLFQHENIDQIIHLGYEDEEDIDFLTSLEDLYNN